MVRKLGIGFVVVAAIVAVVAAVASSGDDGGSGGTTTTKKPREQLTMSMGVVEVMKVDPQFGPLLTYLTSSDVDAVFTKDEEHTIFAPSAAAFGELDGPTKDGYTQDPTGDLTEVLQRHIVVGRLRFGDLLVLEGKTVTNLAGEELPVTVVDGTVNVGGVPLVKSDIDAADGEIHVIDTVIPPAG